MKKTKIRLALAAAIFYHNARKYKSQRRWWVRPIFRERDEKGYFETTFMTMKETDPDKFFKAVRMEASLFDVLLNLIKHRLDKTSLRKSISAECRLAVTLMYLAHGGERFMYSQSFKIGESTLRNIFIDTCEAIWELLGPSIDEYRSIAREYEGNWKMPNCIGAIDGKHINIFAPPNSGTQYFNYKSKFSIILLATCDANYCFTLVDVGAYGSQSDGGVLKECVFGKKLLSSTLSIPNASNLSNGTCMPYYFVGDSAFPLHENLMRPFPGKNLGVEEENFNKRLSHARVTIENTFGIMAARWRVLLGNIHAHPNTVEKFVLAIAVLHNFLMLQRGVYSSPSYGDQVVGGNIIEGQWRNEIGVNLLHITPTLQRNSTRAAYNIRNNLKSYLN